MMAALLSGIGVAFFYAIIGLDIRYKLMPEQIWEI